MTDRLPRSSAASDLATRASLVDRLRASDPAGWDRLVVLYRPLLCHWSRLAGASNQDIEDVCQDVFRVVAQRIGSFRLGERAGSFRGWLREITRNVCREQARRNAAGPRAAGGTDAAIRLNGVVDPAGDEDPPGLVAELLRRAVALARGEFSDAHWAAFERLAFDGQSPAEVAAELGLTEVNVRAIKSRIYRRLREELGETLTLSTVAPEA